MKYEDVREQIKDGDLILIKGKSNTIMHAGTKLVTNSPYTHATVAIWMDNRLWMTEINSGGNHLVPVSQIVDEFDIFECPVDRFIVRTAVLDLLQNHSSYAVLELLRIAIFIYTGKVIHKLNHAAEYVCNEYATEAYVMSGWVNPDKITWPGKLAEIFKPPMFRIEAKQ